MVSILLFQISIPPSLKYHCSVRLNTESSAQSNLSPNNGGFYRTYLSSALYFSLMFAVDSKSLLGVSFLFCTCCMPFLGESPICRDASTPRCLLLCEEQCRFADVPTPAIAVLYSIVAAESSSTPFLMESCPMYRVWCRSWGSDRSLSPFLIERELVISRLEEIRLLKRTSELPENCW